MKGLKLSALLSACGAKLVSGNDVLISSIEENAGDVKKGSLFVCVKGLTADGHDFIPEALSKGASAVLAERKIRTGAASLAVAADTRKALKKIAFFMYGKNLKKAKITGVTGTKGKTTVSYMIASVLEASGRGPVSVIGTVGYRIGKKVYEAKNTTPSNLVLLKLIDESVRKNAREIVMEISSHALDQGRVDNIPLDTAVMTNVTRDHFDYHKNFKNYLAAKLKIVSCLKKNGLLVVNLDDKNADKFIGLAKGRRVCGYSMRRKACVKASGFEPSIKGSKLEVKARGEAIRVDSGLIGEHNAHNLMAAIAATAGKVRPGIIGRALSSFKGVKGRMQAVYNKRFTVVVDFAHTPGSLEETLKALETVKRGRIITVFGAGGNRDKGKRPLMGAAAEDKSDIVIVTSDNPRFEDENEIIKDILAGMRGGVRTLVIPNRSKAIKAAIRMAKENDIVLLAGKGHETYQEIRGRKYPHDDGKAALEAIREIV